MTAETRPWGRFVVLSETETYKVKLLSVNPRCRLSLQLHHLRLEDWLVVTGTPEITLDDRIWTAQPGEHIHVPRGARHRISNPTDALVEIVEVQRGDAFSEDDIVRFEDDYNRLEPSVQEGNRP